MTPGGAHDQPAAGLPPAAAPAPRTAAWRAERLASARVYLCADRHGGVVGDLAAFLDAALAGGVDVVQLRDKTASPDEARAAAEIFRRAAIARDALFVVNDDARLAAQVDADGVHVGQDDQTPAEAREIVGAERVVGLSTHAIDEIDRALAQDCDYLGVGPVHATPTKEGRTPVGLEPVRHAARTSDRPFFVTGGMDAATAPEVLAAGAHGIVVVRALTQAPDPQAAATRLAGLFR